MSANIRSYMFPLVTHLKSAKELKKARKESPVLFVGLYEPGDTDNKKLFSVLAGAYRPARFALAPSGEALGIRDAVPPAIAVYRKEDGFLLLSGLKPGAMEMRRVLATESLGFVEFVRHPGR